MDDPTRRPHGAWPRDRPVRWGALGHSLAWILISTAAMIIQLVLVVPLLIVAASQVGDALGGFARIALALAWGALTLFGAWSWLLGRWRVVLAPLGTIALLLVARAAIG
jgi:hypothetical protein